MGFLKSQISRMLVKRSIVSGNTPTIGPSGDHTDGSWTDTDIYPGEFYFNMADRTLYLGYESGNTSGIMVVNGSYNLKDTTDTAPVSSTALSKLHQILIPAGLITEGTILRFTWRVKKIGIVGTPTYTLRFSPNTTLGSSTSIAVLPSVASELNNSGIRHMVIKDITSNSEIFNISTAVSSDVDVSAAIMSSVPIDWTQDVYIMTAVQNTSAADTIIGSFLNIEIIK